MNPGDFRVFKQTCGECHADENQTVSRSMMAHGAMLWGAALYNNGGFHIKDTRFGESYNEAGNPQALYSRLRPTREEQAFKGYLSFIEPASALGSYRSREIFFAFSNAAAEARLEVGLPDKEEENGKPDKGSEPAWIRNKQSNRSGLSRSAKNASDGSDVEYVGNK